MNKFEDIWYINKFIPKGFLLGSQPYNLYILNLCENDTVVQQRTLFSVLRFTLLYALYFSASEPEEHLQTPWNRRRGPSGRYPVPPPARGSLNSAGAIQVHVHLSSA